MLCIVNTLWCILLCFCLAWESIFTPQLCHLISLHVWWSYLVSISPLWPRLNAQFVSGTFLQVKTPVLLTLGEDDKRVPPKQGIEYYRGLKARNIPVRWVNSYIHTHLGFVGEFLCFTSTLNKLLKNFRLNFYFVITFMVKWLIMEQFKALWVSTCGLWEISKMPALPC